MKQDEDIDRLLGEIPGLAGMADDSLRSLYHSPLPEPSYYRAMSSSTPPSADEDISSALWRLNLGGEGSSYRRQEQPMYHSSPMLRPHQSATPQPGIESLPPYAFTDNQFQPRPNPQWISPNEQAEAIRYFLIQQQLQHQRELMLESQARALAQSGLFPKHLGRGRGAYSNGYSHNGFSPYQLGWPKPLLSAGGYRSPGETSRAGDYDHASVEQLRGRILETAKDQHGCRFLQGRFSEGSLTELRIIFEEVVDHVAELMCDPFGNYLMQKIFENCDEYQRMQMLKKVVANSKLVDISLNMHGTRAVQKLVETLRTREQVGMVVGCLKNGVVELIKDSNGHHVIQGCLKNLTADDNEFILETMIAHCKELAVHRHGCCVLQRCIEFAPDSELRRLIGGVAANSLELSQDAYGNYVVQFVLDRYQAVCREVRLRLAGNFAELSMQKFSSNVVERCLSVFGEEDRAAVVRELVCSPSFEQLLHHEYGNYVIQSSLAAAKGVLRELLVEAIQPYVSALRTSPYGKRILKCGISKKP